jgi:hypothetical protein
MGSYKSYFAAFLALCRHYLRGHQIISIADPHFHQNRDECWECLVTKLSWRPIAKIDLCASWARNSQADTSRKEELETLIP